MAKIWTELNRISSKHYPASTDQWRLDWGQTKTSQIWPKISPDLNQDVENGRPSDVFLTTSWKIRQDHPRMGLWSGLVLNVTGGRYHKVIMTSGNRKRKFRDILLPWREHNWMRKPCLVMDCIISAMTLNVFCKVLCWMYMDCCLLCSYMML